MSNWQPYQRLLLLLGVVALVAIGFSALVTFKDPTEAGASRQGRTAFSASTSTIYDPPPESGTTTYDAPSVNVPFTVNPEPSCFDPPVVTGTVGGQIVTIDPPQVCVDPPAINGVTAYDPPAVQVPYVHDPPPRDIEVAPPPPPPPPPPTTGALRDRPPGWNGGDPTVAASYPGYTVVNATTAGQNLGLNDSTDYFINVSSISWSSQASGRSIGLNITGGRNVVVVGADLTFNSTNNQDDSTGVLISDGNPLGTVYMEGLNVKAANGITLRTKRDVVIQSSRVEVTTFNYDTSRIHPDIIQVWGTNTTTHTPVRSIRLHKFTGLTSYTGLSVLVEIPPPPQVDPIVWDNLEVDLHPRQRGGGNKDAGNMMYLSDSPTGCANGPFTEWKGDVNIELPTFSGGASTRPIDGIVILRGFCPSGVSFFPYEIHGADGSVVYTSPTAPTGGNGPYAETTRVGNYLTFARVPKFTGLRVFVQNGTTIAVPPFSGASYVSPGYG